MALPKFFKNSNFFQTHLFQAKPIEHKNLYWPQIQIYTLVTLAKKHLQEKTESWSLTPGFIMRVEKPRLILRHFVYETICFLSDLGLIHFPWFLLPFLLNLQSVWLLSCCTKKNKTFICWNKRGQTRPRHLQTCSWQVKKVRVLRKCSVNAQS